MYNKINVKRGNNIKIFLRRRDRKLQTLNFGIHYIE